MLKIWFIIIASGFSRLFRKVLICFVDKLSPSQLVVLVRPFIIFKMVFSSTSSKRKVLFVGVRRKCLKVILSYRSTSLLQRPIDVIVHCGVSR